MTQELCNKTKIIEDSSKINSFICNFNSKYHWFVCYKGYYVLSVEKPVFDSEYSILLIQHGDYVELPYSLFSIDTKLFEEEKIYSIEELRKYCPICLKEGK